MEDEAKARLERLAQLKRKKQGESEHKNDAQVPEDIQIEPVTEIIEEKSETLESTVKESFFKDKKATSSISKRVIGGLGTSLDITQLAPKKPTWDLDRDLSKQSKILENRTKNCITLLLKQRLESSSADRSAKSTGATLWRAVKEAKEEADKLNDED